MTNEDEVQKFISNNQWQLGYIMNEASRKWIENDEIGALTVGPCNIFVEKHGVYLELLDKIDRYKQALEDIRELTITDAGTEEQVYFIAVEALKEGESNADNP